ncbi:MAG: tRNA-uridine aminocarboxypropyltransferase [Kangiellaceae bacterium]|nr:tRNA-uridine aminocarboxypropyltransferase [Kangiellaceae bacterium]
MPNSIEPKSFYQLRTEKKKSATRSYEARGKLLKRCPVCALSEKHCVCEFIQPSNCDIDFVIIMHNDEIYKPTNTGKLIGDLFPKNSHFFCYDRTQPEPELLRLINDPNRQCIILFPADEDSEREIMTQLPVSSNKTITLIVLDATWRQSRRMFNSAKWLQNIPAVRLRPAETAAYLTRKTNHADYLSTAESVALCLQLSNLVDPAKKLLSLFHQFNTNYHMMKRNR